MKKKLMSALVTLVMCGRLLTPIVATADEADTSPVCYFQDIRYAELLDGNTYRIETSAYRRTDVIRDVRIRIVGPDVYPARDHGTDSTVGAIRYSPNELIYLDDRTETASVNVVPFCERLSDCFLEVQTRYTRLVHPTLVLRFLFPYGTTEDSHLTIFGEDVTIPYSTPTVSHDWSIVLALQAENDRLREISSTGIGVLGDVDGDGAITVMDAQYTLKYYTCNTVAGMNLTWDQILGKED